jgi:hypothetical protein
MRRQAQIAQISPIGFAMDWGGLKFERTSHGLEVVSQVWLVDASASDTGETPVPHQITAVEITVRPASKKPSL